MKKEHGFSKYWRNLKEIKLEKIVIILWINYKRNIKIFSWYKRYKFINQLKWTNKEESLEEILEIKNFNYKYRKLSNVQ